jgi:hypothetical protein
MPEATLVHTLTSSCKLCLYINLRCISSSDRCNSIDNLLHLCAEPSISLHLSPFQDQRSFKAATLPGFHVILEVTFSVLRLQSSYEV